MMQDPFATGLEALFGGSGASAATFHPGDDGPGVNLRVIRGQPDELAGFGEGQLVMATNLLDIRRVDVASPVTGDEVQLYLDDARTMPGDRLVLTGAPRLDVEGLTWRCPAEPA